MIQSKLLKSVIVGSMIASVSLSTIVDQAPIHAKATSSESYVTNQNVNFRKGPGNNQLLIATLKKGNTVTFISSKVVNQSKWSKVKWNNTVGWIASKYLTKSKSKPITDKITVEKVNGDYLSTANVNMRNSASIDAKIVSTIPKDSVIKVTQINTVNYVKWAYGSINGHKGWISFAYLKKVDTPSSNESTNNSLETIILDKETELFPNSNENEEVVAIIPAGLELKIEKTVVVKNVKWAKVKNDYVNGWIVLSTDQPTN